MRTPCSSHAAVLPDGKRRSSVQERLIINSGFITRRQRNLRPGMSE